VKDTANTQKSHILNQTRFSVKRGREAKYTVKLRVRENRHHSLVSNAETQPKPAQDDALALTAEEPRKSQ
jgi:hypothetical protein